MPVDPEEMKQEIAETSRRIEAGEEEMKALRQRTTELESGGLPTHTALMYLGELQHLQDASTQNHNSLRRRPLTRRW
jgi:hypothetical protein